MGGEGLLRGRKGGTKRANQRCWTRKKKVINWGFESLREKGDEYVER